MDPEEYHESVLEEAARIFDRYQDAPDPLNEMQDAAMMCSEDEFFARDVADAVTEMWKKRTSEPEPLDDPGYVAALFDDDTDARKARLISALVDGREPRELPGGDGAAGAVTPSASSSGVTAADFTPSDRPRMTASVHAMSYADGSVTLNVQTFGNSEPPYYFPPGDARAAQVIRGMHWALGARCPDQEPYKPEATQ